MKEIGQLLKEKRTSMNIPLEEVSIATKINIKILQALEEGDLEKLPAKTFVRGFVQTYAKYLGLNVNEILLKLQEILGSTKPQIALNPQGEISHSEPSEDGGIDFLSKSKNIITISAIVITIVAIIIIQKTVSKREAALNTTEIEAITGSDTPVTIAQASPAPTATVSPTPTPAPTHTVASPTPTPSVKVAAQVIPTPAPTPKATPSPVQKPVATPTPVAVVKPVATPAETTPQLNTPAVPQEVIVEALDNIVISVSIDGKPSQDVNMTADQIQTFKAKSKIKLSTSNSGAISVIHNGKELGVPGNLGQPKTISFPQ